MNPTLTEQLAEARAELAIRHRAYPKWVQDGRMNQTTADRKLACMAAIVATLDKLVGLEETSKAMLGEGTP